MAKDFMAEHDSPTIARRRVRLALREFRDRAGVTQQQVADEMDWSLSKVIRIESGDVSIAVNDLRPLLAFLGVTDRAVVNKLVADARLARLRQRQAWYEKPRYREHLSDSLRKLIQYEAEAFAIRYYSVYFIPGPLQIPEYAQGLLNLFADEITKERRETLLEARRLRHEGLLSRVGAVRLRVLLDESVLHRPLGGPEMFTAQLRELMRLAGEELAAIRMVPFSLEAPVTNNATFDLVSLGATDDEGMVLYYENGMTDELDESPVTTSRHRTRFDKVWHEAADEEDTINFIRGRITELEAAESGRRQRMH
jgi:transcriptional regulator with XRE-family HTH domain